MIPPLLLADCSLTPFHLKGNTRGQRALTSFLLGGCTTFLKFMPKELKIVEKDRKFCLPQVKKSEGMFF